METWAATAELRQDLNFLRGSKAFKNYMEANHKGMFDIFMRAAEVAVRSFNDKQKQDSLNNGLNKILRYWAGSNIAFRLNTAMKQVLSYPAFPHTAEIRGIRLICSNTYSPRQET